MKNKFRIKKILSFILAVVISISILLPLPVFGEAVAEDDSPVDLVYFVQIMEFIKSNYFKDVKEEQLLEGGIKGLFYYLDENSSYYTKEEFAQLLEEITGDFVGIGIFLKEEDGKIIVIDTIKNGPAHKAGIKPNDVIIEVDGQDVRGLSLEKVVDLMKDKPNTKMNIKVQRGDEIKEFTLTRAIIVLSTVDYEILEDNIGYIKLSQFSQYSYNEMINALKELDKQKIFSIILDLRGNPGGLLDSVLDISRLFIPEGPIVHIKYRKNNVVTYYSNLKKPKYKLVVLVDENSASASEIFAGAVQDRKAGTVVGVTTYGKGTVQQIIPLLKGDGMKLTIAEYLTPNKRSINGKGIKPDIIVENKSGKDLQLKKAVELLTK
ncbi:carboxyl-terminal processing protease [Keratinibaculum paraultunense]|uniref:Carboxyl-terminal processing protease n=1 Tax=Keratinibaculum paraultunense TaxID=1278232 RepID=A0A4R3L202_9FIRM|nr:S41 family peptidase [Keratinibaculum paraultunense]QQY79928.1 S41 family peptidase [Keratinibaculum paraultunense]TCS91753.1 carboxyl-terminal processing protease [Keratinibaculum paraultunense]